MLMDKIRWANIGTWKKMAEVLPAPSPVQTQEPAVIKEWSDQNIDIDGEHPLKEVNATSSILCSKTIPVWKLKHCRIFIVYFVRPLVQHRKDAGRTKEEIEKLSMDENLGDLDRAKLFIAVDAHRVSFIILTKF